MTKAYVLDTNVLIHDPAALFSFESNEVHLTITVLEELDKLKHGRAEISHQARIVSRLLSDLLKGFCQKDLPQGVPLNNEGGRLFLSATRVQDSGLDLSVPDNRILAEFDHLDLPDGIEKCLVSNDVNMRLKGMMLGYSVDEYQSDRVISDLSAMISGYREDISEALIAASTQESRWDEQLGVHVLKVDGSAGLAAPEYPGMFLFSDEAIYQVRRLLNPGKSDWFAEISKVSDKCSAWGVSGQNAHQAALLAALLDPNYHLVTIGGPAGTGKTLLSLAVGLHSTLEDRLYQRILVTRETIEAGEKIGFLPGTEAEKMAGWMGAVHDNLEVLLNLRGNRGASQAAGFDGKALLEDKIQMKSVGLMRGRTLNNTYVLIDEAQNLTPKQMRTLITRAGEGSKFVVMGNVRQIDSPYLSPTNNGFTYLVQKMAAWENAAHITLDSVVRSPLAEFGESVL